MDRPVALAAAETDGQTSPNVTGSSRWHLELLSDEGTDGCGGSVQREHQNSVTPRPRLSRHELSAAEGTALGSHQDRIRRFPESRVECAFVQIVVQNLKIRRLVLSTLAPILKRARSITKASPKNRQSYPGIEPSSFLPATPDKKEANQY